MRVTALTGRGALIMRLVTVCVIAGCDKIWRYDICLALWHLALRPYDKIERCDSRCWRHRRAVTLWLMTTGYRMHLATVAYGCALDTGIATDLR